ncbi:ICL/PEPM family protein (plasmid) [Rhizobium gallicum]|uniref:ICL/PEPM family protein n=1 Tax=Rhizobium gallicum TaxID=56730 RepID=A0A1L5NS31_9HYPH|nr:isocitrate lyase/PEP mutase family protein [Rhizobium gallicum]APO70716.1 ICL/PEPM family protein [Rhizobium gallicum]
MSDARKQLRKLLNSGYTMAPGAYDVLTAMLVEQAGFSAVYMTGGGFSRSNGFPDYGLLTLTEITNYLSRTSDAVTIPVIADADTGHGNAINVIRTVREFEKTGVAGFHLEDQVSPKKCGHYEGKLIVPAEEMVGKIKAAVDTRKDQDMVIIARSDARAGEGLNAAIDRVSAYLDAGADLGFVEAPRSEEELAEITRQEPRAAFCNIFEGGKTPPVPSDRLEAMGYRIGIYPSQTHRAAIRAAQTVLETLKRAGSAADMETGIATFQDREMAVRTSWWQEQEANYLQLDALA